VHQSLGGAGGSGYGRVVAKIVIVGAGFGGLAAAIELRRHGFDDITILEKAPDLGGTWYYNSYPGAACDVPSHLYSFSYAQRRDWDRLCPLRDDILAYMKEVAREHGVDALVRTGVEVTSCEYDDERVRWTVGTAGGETYDADAVIIATGQLHHPAVPRFEGAERFAGRSFHTAEWDHDYDLAGKRVAIIGTGATSVQVVPEIAPQVERLYVFQRTGNWFLPRRNRRYPRVLRWAFERVPGLQQLRRLGVFLLGELITASIRHPRLVGPLLATRSRIHMRMQLRDPEVRRKAWPDYTFGCKRVLFSSTYLPALQRDNVELVTDRIARLTEHGIVTDDGAEREVDCIIYATGFNTHQFMFPMEVRGAGGRDLREEWVDGPHAYLGMMVPGFPSMFLLYGPNTNTSGGSILVFLEAQVAWIRQALQAAAARRAAAVDVRPEAEAQLDAALQARFRGTAWTDCDSWYRDEQGRIVSNWPGYMREYVAATRTLDASKLDFIPQPAPVPA